MHMLHMHISIDIIITLSFFITDFLLSSVLNGVSALDGGIVTLSAGFVNPLFYIPAICKKIRQQSPTVCVFRRKNYFVISSKVFSHLLCIHTKGMKKSHQAALDGSQSGTKASQNSPPAMAANNLDHFLPRHVRGKKYFARRECFFAHLWAEKRGSK